MEGFDEGLSHSSTVEENTVWSTGLHEGNPTDEWGLGGCHAWRNQALVVLEENQHDEDSVLPLALT